MTQEPEELLVKIGPGCVGLIAYRRRRFSSLAPDTEFKAIGCFWDGIRVQSAAADWREEQGVSEVDPRDVVLTHVRAFINAAAHEYSSALIEFISEDEVAGLSNENGAANAKQALLRCYAIAPRLADVVADEVDADDWPSVKRLARAARKLNVKLTTPKAPGGSSGDEQTEPQR